MWFITTGVTRDGRCALRCATKMPHPTDFEPMPGGSAGFLVHGTTRDIDAVTFYPELRYAGYRVTVKGWDFDSSEPLLHCWIDSSEIASLGLGEQGYIQRMREFEADGWRWDMKEGGQKYVHVDDLEKIEGPPPEGPC